MAKPNKHPFYGHEIYRDRQQEYISKLLQKYKSEPVDDNLKKKIWDDLQKEKYEGRITIPFKVAMRRDPAHKIPDYIEVILDTKV